MRTVQAGKLGIQVYDTRAQMGAAAAKEALGRLAKIVAEKGEASVMFAAAPSQNELLMTLRGSDFDWQKVRAFHMDEYVGLSGKGSFAAFLQDAIWDALPFAATYPMDGLNDPAAECARYSALLRENPPDLILCGIGENCHLAFNDPWVADFEDPDPVKVVQLDDACRQQQVNDGCFPSLDQVPTHAITVTLPVFRRAPQILCVVPGATKAEAVRNTQSRPIGPQYPSTLLREHPDAILYCDAASAALL